MNEINNEQSPVMNNNNQNLKPTKSNNILVIVLLVIIVGLVGYMAYDKLIKKDTTTQNNNSQEEARQDETKQDETIKPAMSDVDATDLGLNTYSKLQKFMNSLDVEQSGSCEGNPNCGGSVAGNGAYLHKNFLNEFKSLFSSNVKLNDVFVEYDINNDTYKCNFSNDCSLQSASENYTYFVKNNEYYFDTFCRAGGCEAGLISDFKLVTNEENKLVYTYKVLRKKSFGDEMCDFQSEKEYNDYVKNSQVYKLELVKEDNTWKVNRGSFIAKCNNTVSFNQ